MTATELEQRLLKFTRERLAPPEVADEITVDTRLFEDRVIDSLKVLELIAYVQSALGRRIPDAQIVLANFRSIATIARVFTGAAPLEPGRARSRDAFRRTNGNVARPAYAKSAVKELFGRRDLELTSDGGLIMRGPAASLRDYFDGTVRGWALEMGAIEERFPTEIPLATLGRAGFTTAFPQMLVWNGESCAGNGAPAGEECVKPPAVCYHHYPRFADTTLGARGSLVTAVGRCYRNEYRADSSYPIERLRSFTMREIIAVGDDELVEKLRNDMMERVSLWMKELAIDGRIETASDPFFTSESKGRLLMQQMLPLKYELQLRVDPDGRTVAAASFNNHEQHFGKAFSIRQSSGELAHTGCVAFGWERWVIAFINQHGADAANWPASARSRDVAPVSELREPSDVAATL
jgi:acyl carrier protein